MNKTTVVWNHKVTQHEEDLETRLYITHNSDDYAGIDKEVKVSLYDNACGINKNILVGTVTTVAMRIRTNDSLVHVGTLYSGIIQVNKGYRIVLEKDESIYGADLTLWIEIGE